MLEKVIIYTKLGHNCHIRQFCKVSIELFCADKTAIYGSFMDTFFSPTKLPYMAVLRTLFDCLSQNPYKTADLSSSMDTIRLSEPIFMYGATELPYMAVLWTLYKTAVYGSCAQVIKR